MQTSAAAPAPVSTTPRVAPAPDLPAATPDGAAGAPHDAANSVQPAGFFTPRQPDAVVRDYFAKLRAKDQVAIIAQLREQADLSGIDATDRADRRVAVWNALTDTAERTQPPVRELLDGLKGVDAYEGYALGNTFEIAASRKGWQGVYDALKATDQFSLMIASDSQKILAYDNEDAAAAARAKEIMEQDGGVNPLDGIRDAIREDRRERTLGKQELPPGSDPETWMFREDGVAWNPVQIGADKAWEQGITGKGIRVGVLDTGVDGRHPMLRHAVSDADDPFTWHADMGTVGDRQGHGTHVAGTIAGRDPEGKRHPGVAPDAGLMVANMSSGSLVAPFQWFLAPGAEGEVDPRKGADIINNSWGIMGPAQPIADAFTQPFRQLKEAGTMVVFAAGNSGPTEGSIYAPGDNPEVFTIGATKRDGTIARFSSRAREGQVKPDVSAPGEDVPSAVPVSNVGSLLPAVRLQDIVTGGAIPGMPRQLPIKGTDGAMWKMAGTSMAAPTTSGAIALLMQRHPTLTPDQIATVLKESSVDMGEPGHDGAYGHGRIDLTRAFEAAAKLDGADVQPTA